MPEVLPITQLIMFENATKQKDVDPEATVVNWPTGAIMRLDEAILIANQIMYN